MSNNTWTRVEEGASVRDTTYVRVDQVLGWPRGTCLAIIKGEEEPAPGDIVEGFRHSRVGITEDDLRQVIQDATITTLPDLTGAQIRALHEQAVKEARRLGLIPHAGDGN